MKHGDIFVLKTTIFNNYSAPQPHKACGSWTLNNSQTLEACTAQVI